MCKATFIYWKIIPLSKRVSPPMDYVLSGAYCHLLSATNLAQILPSAFQNEPSTAHWPGFVAEKVNDLGFCMSCSFSCRMNTSVTEWQNAALISRITRASYEAMPGWSVGEDTLQWSEEWAQQGGRTQAAYGKQGLCTRYGGGNKTPVFFCTLLFMYMDFNMGPTMVPQWSTGVRKIFFSFVTIVKIITRHLKIIILYLLWFLIVGQSSSVFCKWIVQE